MRQVSKVNHYACETQNAGFGPDSHEQGLLRWASGRPTIFAEQVSPVGEGRFNYQVDRMMWVALNAIAEPR
jgi:hypothetical protein